MAETFEPKNYNTDGGDTLVIGGTLRILDDATVEGLDGGGGGAVAAGDVTVTAIADTAGANVQAVLEDLAARLKALEDAAV